VSKLNVSNTFATSTNQRVKVYGLPALSLGSPSSSYPTEPYTDLSSAPYPYATSTNTQAVFRLPAGSSHTTGEYGSATVSTVNESASLTISDWAWYGGSTGSTRLGRVPDPSISKQEGPSSAVDAMGNPRELQPSDWISMNITLTNTNRPTQIVDGQFTGELPRPTAVISYPDFGYGAYSDQRSRAEQIFIETGLAQRSIIKVNPNSSGALAAPKELERQCTSPLINQGRSCAGDGDSATNFVRVVVLAPGASAPVPNRLNPVTAHFLCSTPGVDGVDPVSSFELQSSARLLKRFALTPGASVTFQVRAMVAVFEVPGCYKPLLIARMREEAVVNGQVETSVIFAGCAEFPRFLCEGLVGVGRVSRPAGAPRDRQEWAHLLKLYNRSLRIYGSPGDGALRQGKF
jgi:hypothetical protein